MNALSDLLRGRGAHADPVACFDGIDAAVAGRRLAGAQHTIWQLLFHLNYWMDYELRSIAGPELPYPQHAEVSWPASDGPPDATAWDGERHRLAEQLRQLEASGRDAAIQGRVVHPARGETVADVLWQIVAHNSYHVGQVALLRRAFGAWPPPAGGDTW
jgi:uncharacterized damage-inducible protein DinB